MGEIDEVERVVLVYAARCAEGHESKFVGSAGDSIGSYVLRGARADDYIGFNAGGASEVLHREITKLLRPSVPDSDVWSGRYARVLTCALSAVYGEHVEELTRGVCPVCSVEIADWWPDGSTSVGVRVLSPPEPELTQAELSALVQRCAREVR